jgi:hypothetical protein
MAKVYADELACVPIHTRGQNRATPFADDAHEEPKQRLSTMLPSMRNYAITIDLVDEGCAVSRE